jgi:hypothetical protein
VHGHRTGSARPHFPRSGLPLTSIQRYTRPRAHTHAYAYKDIHANTREHTHIYQHFTHRHLADKPIRCRIKTQNLVGSFYVPSTPAAPTVRVRRVYSCVGCFHTSIHAYIHAYTHTCIHACIHALGVFMRILMRIFMRVSVRVFMRVFILVSMRISMRVFMRWMYFQLLLMQEVRVGRVQFCFVWVCSKPLFLRRRGRHRKGGPGRALLRRLATFTPSHTTASVVNFAST